MTTKIIRGDCLDVLRRLDAGSVDAVITDPPYGLEFMGKDWDSFGVPGKKPKINPGTYAKMSKHGRPSGWSASGNPSCLNCGGDKYRNGDRKCVCADPAFPNHSGAHNRRFQEWSQQWATECLRVLRPGGYLMAFGGTRTYHRLVCAIEDAGFEIRDSVLWLYGQGFPKGKGCLKPAWEPITLARKPGPKVLPLGIEECRIGTSEIGSPREHHPREHREDWRITGGSNGNGATSPAGRWPPNVLLQHHPECLCTGSAPVRSNGHYPKSRGKGGNGTNGHAGQAGLDERFTSGESQLTWQCHPDCVVRELGRQSGPLSSGGTPPSRPRASAKTKNAYGTFEGQENPHGIGHSTGTAARFFPQFRYAAKASRSERNAGCDDPGPQFKHGATLRKIENTATAGNNHPTVKPLAIMEWLVRLACPPGGVVADPFLGSGTTAVACIRTGRNFVGCDNNPEYLKIARARIKAARLSPSVPSVRSVVQSLPPR